MNDLDLSYNTDHAYNGARIQDMLDVGFSSSSNT